MENRFYANGVFNYKEGLYLLKFNGNSVVIPGDKKKFFSHFTLSKKGFAYFALRYMNVDINLGDILVVDTLLESVTVIKKKDIHLYFNAGFLKRVKDCERAIFLREKNVSLDEFIFDKEMMGLYNSILIAGGII